MSRPRNDSLFVLLIALMMGGSASALPARMGDVAEAFATCAGRMGAMATRARAFDHIEAAEFDRMRGAFNDLLAALAVEDDAARYWRNAGWAEMAQLLSEVDFGIDARRAAQSGDVLARRIRTCRRMVLPGT